MKRLYSVLLICAAMAGMMLSITSTEAADLAKVRGRVNIDLDTFVCVEKTNNNSGMEPDTLVWETVRNSSLEREVRQAGMEPSSQR